MTNENVMKKEMLYIFIKNEEIECMVVPDCFGNYFDCHDEDKCTVCEVAEKCEKKLYGVKD